LREIRNWTIKARRKKETRREKLLRLCLRCIVVWKRSSQASIS